MEALTISNRSVPWEDLSYLISSPGSLKISPQAKRLIKISNDALQAILKKGSKLAIPTQGGKETEFDIDDVKGDMVTLKNPLAKKGEPTAFVYNKKELDQVVKQKADQATGGNDPMAGKVV